MPKLILHFFVTLLLTVLTQIGGVIYLLSILIASRLKLDTKRFVGLFTLLYLAITLTIIPYLAPIFGRQSLPLFGQLSPLRISTVLLNRQYVRPTLHSTLIDVATEIAVLYPNTKTHYLDANFPFFDGFPLFPHLSHNDGKKVDLAFFYTDSKSGQALNDAPSPTGYGIFEAATSSEIDYATICKNKGYWQYGLLDYLTPKWNKDKMKVDVMRTKKLLILLSKHPQTSKIFLEPHLKARWGLSHYDKIRFHGCQAVRHDDHIHIQVK